MYSWIKAFYQKLLHEKTLKMKQSLQIRLQQVGHSRAMVLLKTTLCNPVCNLALGTTSKLDQLSKGQKN